jgi:phenylacetate-CoA ligase
VSVAAPALQRRTEDGGWRRYWDEERETLPADERRRVIFERIKFQLDYAYHAIPFYRDLYDRHGVRPDDIRHLEDFTEKVPVVTKAMLRESQEAHPPFGDYLGVDPLEVARVQGTSGTTGAPTLFAISADDWAHISEAQAMQCWAAGLRPDDLVQMAFPLGLFVGGWGLLGAAEKIGAAVLPAGAGGTERQVALLARTHASVLCATPTYALHLAEKAAALGRDSAASSLRLGFFGGEPGAGVPATKRRLEAAWGLSAIDFGNVAELHPCSNMECAARTGMHAWIDVDYTEVVRPGEPAGTLPMGETGAVVYTHLWRRSQPMIRYYPGDETVMTDEPCICGRTYPRLPRGIIGRLDDLIILRGVKFYPTAVEDALRTLDGLGTEFRIRLCRAGELDEATIEVELATGRASVGEARDALQGEAEAKLKSVIGLRLPVRLQAPGTLEGSDFKARRVIDERPEAIARKDAP